MDLQRLTAAALTLAATFTGFFAPDANACGPAPCLKGSLAPGDGATLPENAPALVLTRPVVYGNLVQDAGFSLWHADGGAASYALGAHGTDPRSQLLFPTNLDPAATYELRYVEPCDTFGPSQPDAGQVISVAFAVTAAAPLPTEGGALESHTTVEEAYQVPAEGSCVAPIRAAVAHLEVAPSASLMPFLPVTRWLVSVDGQQWSTSAWDGYRSQGDGGTLVTNASGGIPPLSPNRIHARCEPIPTGSGHHAGVAEGVHVVSVVAEIAGHGALPAIETTIDLRCDADGGDGGTTDGGGDADGGGADAGTDADTTDAGTNGGTDPGGPAPGCGCSGGGAGAASSLMLLLALGRVLRRRSTV